jgi:hypothetical protein
MGYGPFDTLIPQLFSTLREEGLPLRLTVFGAPETERLYLLQRESLREMLAMEFGDSMPAWSYIAQPPCGGATLAVDACYIVPDKEDVIAYKTHCFTGEGDLFDVNYVTVENADGRFLFAGGITDPDRSRVESDMLVQAEYSLDTMTALLQLEGFPLSSVQRQWNYIERITDMDGSRRRYGMFNTARTICYRDGQWTGGYPAATGIGASFGGVVIELEAAVFNRPEATSYPIDNALQVPAYKYSDKVLMTGDAKQPASGFKDHTPKFERARCLSIDGRMLIYVSGTAAIRGEASLSEAGLAPQIEATMENLLNLTGNVRLRTLRIYLKNASDYEEAVKLINKYVTSDVDIIYMCADVCREELLIEIEGIAL